MHKIQFTSEELTILNDMEVIQNKRNKLMSVYSYLIKYSQDSKLIKPVATLYTIYVRSHIKISLAYFKRLILELSEVGLVVIDKTSRKYKYFIPRKVAEKVAENKVATTTENTSVESNLEKRKYKTINNTYTYTYNTDPKESVCTIDNLVNIANGLFKEYGIKSFSVKEMVLAKIRNCNNINIAGAIAYISKVIAEKKGIQESKRAMFLKNKVKNKPSFDKNTYKSTSKELKFNNFTAREMYSDAKAMQDLEAKLLGWC